VVTSERQNRSRVLSGLENPSYKNMGMRRLSGLENPSYKNREKKMELKIRRVIEWIK